MKTPLPLVFIAAFFVLLTASAQTVTWTGTADSNFNNSDNWSGGMPSSTSDAVFTAGSTRTNVIVTGYTMLGSLTFNGVFPSYNFSGANAKFALATGISVGTTSGSFVAFDPSVSFELNGNQTWTTDSNLSVRGVIQGTSGALTKAGSMNLTLEGDNTFAGGMTIAAGKVIARNLTGSATGSGPVTINSGATLQIGSGSTSGAVIGSITNNGSLVFDRVDGLPPISSGNSVYFSHDGLITGTGGVTIAHGALGFTAANTYTGGTTISAGRLIALNATGSATGSADVVVGGDGIIQFGRATAYGAISGNVQLGTVKAAVLFARTDNFRYDGIISGQGTIQQSGSGTVTLGGVNTFQGDTHLVTGVVADGVAGAFSSASKLHFYTGGGLAVNFNETVRGIILDAPPSISSTASIALASGATLTINNAAGSYDDFTGTISGAGSLAKIGTGGQVLAGVSTFSGGTTLTGGALLVRGSSARDSGGALVSGPLGTGSVTLGDATQFGVGSNGARIDNAVTVGNNVTLFGSKDDDFHFELGGPLTLAGANTLLQVKGDTPVLLWGALSGPAGATLTIDGGDALALLGTTAASVTSLVANAGGIIFGNSAALPSTVSVTAVNGGYAGIVVSGDSTTWPTAALLRSRITNPAAFQGTFGFDSDPDLAEIQVYAEDLDFSAFTDPAFRIGSGTSAILTGAITPPTIAGKPLYAFGGGHGHLVVASSLADVAGAPASVLVASPAGSEPQAVLFRGSNSFTGTTTVGTITANLIVDHAAAVFDAPGSLPAGATFAFGTTGPAYVGATEAAGFTTFADFAARVAASGYGSNSILGIDSHEYYDFKIANGPDADFPNRAKFDGSIDLHAFSSIYLGTSTDMILSGAITPPANGELRLTTLDDARLTIASDLGASVNSLVIGVAANASEEFSDGVVELTGSNTYGGGTTFYSGTLELNPRMLPDGSGQPLGTGPLTVAAGGVSEAVLRGPENRAINVDVPIVLNTRLQINERAPTAIDPALSTDSTQIYFGGTISGPGSLDVFRTIAINQANTYTGGTILNPGTRAVLGSGEAFGTGPLTMNGTVFLLFWQGPAITVANALTIDGTMKYGANAGLVFTGPVSLQRETRIEQQWGPALGNAFEGNISGPGSLSIGSRWGMDVQFRLSGSNTYSGGTTADGTTLIFLTPGSVPVNGQLRSWHGSSGPGYIGVGYTTNTRASFLDKFDRQNSDGVIGFDSADPTNPNVFTEDIDLAGFHPDTRLGSASIATLAGNITPAGANYRFGDNGGTLIVTSALSGSRLVDARSTRNPLTLVLQGANSYTGGTAANSSIVRFDAAAALPASGSFTADSGYIGMTEAVGLSLSSFIGRFATAVNGVIGLDSGNLAAPRTIDDPIVLTSYSTLPSAYLGTSTALTLNGAVTPVGTDLRLAAVGRGSLILNSAVTSNSLVLGAGSFLSRNATVTLNAASAYSGGTSINGTHVLVGHASALGTGPISVAGDGASLGTNVDGLTLMNSLTAGGGFSLDGTHSFTFGGTITAPDLRKTGAGTVSLTGHNTALGSSSGYVMVDAGRLVLGQNDSLGTATLQVAPGAIAEFVSLAPSIGGLSGGMPDSTHPLAGVIKLADTATLTINGSGYFGGEITGNAALSLGGTSTLSLGSANTYTGGTTIGTGAVLYVGHNSALGTTGAVTLSGGTLSVPTHVTLAFNASHPLVFNSGRLAGSGTVASDSSLAVGTGDVLAGGQTISGSAVTAPLAAPGVLTLSFGTGANLVFDSGGRLEFRVADASQGSDGWSRIAVTGGLDIAATAAAPFNLTVSSVGYDGNPTFAQGFNPGLAYSWTLLTATSITGFDPTKFSIDAAGFANMPVNAGFSIGVNDVGTPTSLLLNYNPAAVPEPATWLLLLSGLAALAVGARRRAA